MSLKNRIMFLVASLASLSILVGLVLLWYSFQTNAFFKKVIDEHMAALRASDELESALVMQKGYITYFFQDNHPKWLDELARRDIQFKEWLIQARKWAATPEREKILVEIENDYKDLSLMRSQVIDLYKAGNKEEGFRIHQEARKQFFKILELCREYRHEHEQDIAEARARIGRRAVYVTHLALATMGVAVLLSALLAFILFRQILGPIRLLVRKASQTHQEIYTGDEVQALSRGVHILMEDVDQTRSELELSRIRLLQSAKMASVGKLAASVAHSIRNPLTSVKMRLFSLERSLDVSDDQREDFNVIGGEIRHIDNVLRNFLEFSRRPKLKVQSVSPSEVVDMALDLVGPRLNLNDIKLHIERTGLLPPTRIDPDQLKEALVNLLVNSADAVGLGGEITIEEKLERDPSMGRIVTIRVRDNGPGVPQALHEQIFQLFFSTKDEGTGLGLSIATRIVEEHGGEIQLTSPPEGGAVFTIKLPAGEV